MGKTLSLGAFEELDEREVMETEGGGIGIITVAAIASVATVCVVGFPIVANKVVSIINKISDILAPAGMPNPNHIWTVF